MTGGNEGHSDAGLSAQWEALLDAYLDGRLSEADAALVRRRAAADPVLGRELALQSRVDDSIRRVYAVPEMAGAASVAAVEPAAPAPLPMSRAEVTAGRGRGRRLMLWPLAAAAALALFIGGYWAVIGSPLGDSSHVSAQVAYRHIVDDGFAPKWVCKDQKEFAEYTKGRLGAAWTIDPQPGLTLVGWLYCDNVLGPDADMLLATSGESKIVVLADRKVHARPLKDGGGLHVFTREAGDVVMYEISPLDKPVVISAVKVECGGK